MPFLSRHRGPASSTAIAANERRGDLRIWQEIDGILQGSAAKGEPGMFATIIKLFKNEDGATAIEYGLIAALIAVAAVTVLGTVGTNLTSTFTTVANKL